MLGNMFQITSERTIMKLKIPPSCADIKREKNSVEHKQAEKLKSREMKEGRMKSDEGWMKNDERWRMNDAVWWFQAVEGFCWQTDIRTNKQTDICDCRVAFATEKIDASTWP